MSTTPAGVEYRPLVIPESIDAADATDFHAMTAVRNAVYRHISGHDDQALLPSYRPEPYEIRMMWLVLDDGRPVGRVGLDLPIETDSRVAYMFIELLPDVWGRGIGTGALELIERVARENRRTVLQSWVEHPDRPGPRLEPPTGFGSIPAVDPGARFFVRHGFTLEQIERNSALDLRDTRDNVDRLLAEATVAAEGYRIVSWNAPTPPEFADGYAWMKSRMVTDAPSAAIEFDEETWDAARVALNDARAIDAGRLLHVTAAQHIETGELCAFNELAIGPDRTAASHQEDTLVLSEHRDHRLGMLVKCAGLRAWRDLAPESPRVITYNAEENRPMLDINEAIGFVPIAYEGAWKKVLDV
ncbi:MULTISPECIES: GNAT family N-acetyltransferase [Bacteria]